MRVDVLTCALQRAQIARRAGGKLHDGKSQGHSSRFNIEIIRRRGGDSPIEIYQLPCRLPTRKIDNRTQIDRGEIQSVKKFRFELKREQSHAGVAYFIAMVHTRRMVNAGERLISKLREARRLAIFTSQHQ